MALRDVKLAVSVALRIGIPVCMWGEPGTGKSSYAAALVNQLENHELVTIWAGPWSEESLMGVPKDEGDAFRFIPPKFVRDLYDVEERGHVPVLLIEELTQASRFGQRGLMRLIRDKICGENPLPQSTKILVTANSPEDAGGYDLIRPLSNRLIHLTWPVDAAERSRAFHRGGKWENPVLEIPAGWESEIPTAFELIGRFLDANPQMGQMKPDDPSTVAWPSSRSWGDLAVPLLAACRAAGAPVNIISMLMAASVGRIAASEFMVWMRENDLPTASEVLADPESPRWPALRMDQISVITSSVIGLLDSMEIKEVRAEIISNIWSLIDNFVEHKLIDAAMLIYRKLMRAMTEEEAQDFAEQVIDFYRLQISFKRQQFARAEDEA